MEISGEVLTIFTKHKWEVEKEQRGKDVIKEMRGGDKNSHKCNYIFTSNKTKFLTFRASIKKENL